MRQIPTPKPQKVGIKSVPLWGRMQLNSSAEARLLAEDRDKGACEHFSGKEKLSKARFAPTWQRN